jgi:hypothetical protein
MSIVKGIKKYGNEDAEVATFGKILKNEINERFVDSFKQAKQEIKNAFKRFKGTEECLVTEH